MTVSFTSLWQRVRSGTMLQNGSDPQPPRRPNQQPPDLDELWRDFNQRLSRLFGTPSGDGQDSGQRPGGSHNGMPAWLPLAVIVAGLVWLGSGVFIVQEGQQAIISRLGKMHSKVGPGISWRFPYPFEKHETVDVMQLRSVEIGSSTQVGATGLLDSSMLTQDENIVDVRFTVQYVLKSAEDFLFQNKDTDKAVLMAAESAIREVVGGVGMDTVLKDRESIQRDVRKSIQVQLDRYRSGVDIKNVNIQNVQPPSSVQAAFDDALKAGQDRERLRYEGQIYANKLIAEAKGKAARLTEESEGYKARVIGQAQGDAERFDQVVAQYQKAPQVTRDRLYLDAMQQVYSKTNKVLVDSRNSSLITLPLEKLLTGKSADKAPEANANAASAAAPDASTSVSAGAVPDARMRDSGRSRERDTR